jgi:DNA-binding transcriptional MerR regulator
MKPYSIQMTSVLSGVSPDCIRAWERRYGAIVPERDRGRRVFDDGDVGRLQMLKELSLLGNPISSVAKLRDEELSKLCSELGIQLGGQKAFRPKDPKDALELILLALDSSRFDILLHELNKTSDELNPKDFSESIMAPVLERFYQLGFSETQKKALVGIFKSVINRKLSLVSKTSKQAVVGFTRGERTELKALMASLLLTHNGFKIGFSEECSDLTIHFEASKILGAELVLLEMAPEQESDVSYYLERSEHCGFKGELIFSGLNGSLPLDVKLKNL